MATRYQVFISSTYVDLVEERNKVIEQILTMGHIPVGMEMFSADDAEQWEVIQREIDQSDYYIVIVKQRYGSTIRKEHGISFTEKEFDYAGVVGVPRIGFIVANGVAVPPGFMEETAAARRKLDAFKKKIRTKPVSFFSTPDELSIQVLQALNKQIAKGGRPGWVRATEDDRQALASFARLSDKNAELQAEVERLRTLTSENIPRLECVFSGQAGPSDIMFFNPGPPTTLEERGKTQLAHFNQLVAHLNQLQAQTPSTKGQRSIYGMPNLGLPYRFDQARLGNVLRILRAVGAERPSQQEMWTFENLSQNPIPHLNVHGIYSPPEPESGLDLNKYRVFRDLEQQANTIWNDVQAHNYRRRHVEVRLMLANVSTTAAEELTVRLDFADDVLVGLFALDDQRRPSAVTGAQFEEEVALLAPEDSVKLKPLVIEVDQQMPHIHFNVRLTGKNLPRAQILPMQIVVGEPPADEPASGG